MRELIAGKSGSVPWVRVAGVAATAVGVALAAPLIWGLVSAGLGLVALMVVGVLGIGFYKVLPMLGQLVEVKVLAGRKAIARGNPIEQLQTFLRTKAERVRQFRDAVSAIGAQIESLEDMVVERKRQKPGFDASRQERSIKAMRTAHEQLRKKYEAADKALGELKERIEDKKFEWQFGQAGQAAMRSMNATSGEDLLNEMLADEAFSAVRDNFNKVFADLELEAGRINQSHSLEFDGMTLDVSAIEIPDMVPVKTR